MYIKSVLTRAKPRFSQSKSTISGVSLVKNYAIIRTDFRTITKKKSSIIAVTRIVYSFVSAYMYLVAGEA
jgi:hypothetical protein